MKEEIAIKISKLQQEIVRLKAENHNYAKNETYLIEVSNHTLKIILYFLF